MVASMEFEFATSSRIIFGMGKVSQIGFLASGLGKKVLWVTGSGSRSIDQLKNSLESNGIVFEIFQVKHEPDTHLIEQGIALAKSSHCDAVISLGGGSVIDTGKAIAAMLTNPGELIDYLEVIGRGKQLRFPSAPMIAIPTTSGTGTEVTRNAVIAYPEQKIKVSMRGSYLLPTIALIDPELTLTLPPNLTAACGLDALTQLIEGYTTYASNPVTDALAREGMVHISRSLRQAYYNPTDIEARENMALASLFSGLVLANAGLGAVHGFAGVIGGMFDAPHGAVCGCLLPWVMKENIQSCELDLTKTETVKKFREIASILTNNQEASVSDGLAWIHQIVEEFRIPRLADFGINVSSHQAIIEKAIISSSMKKNPVKLDNSALEKILLNA